MYAVEMHAYDVTFVGTAVVQAHSFLSFTHGSYSRTVMNGKTRLPCLALSTTDTRRIYSLGNYVGTKIILIHQDRETDSLRIFML